MLPERMPGDSAREFWEPASNLEAKVVTLDELRVMFPANEEFTEVDVLSHRIGFTRYNVYGRLCKDKNGKIVSYEPLAYECPSCNQIVLGPPKIKDDLSIREGAFQAGREGYDEYCQNCYERIGSVTLALS